MAHRAKHRDAAWRRRHPSIVPPGQGGTGYTNAEPAAEPRVPTAYEESILLGLQQKPHVYQGAVAEMVRPRTSTGPLGVTEPFQVEDVVTVGRRLTEQKIAERRIRNRAAKRSRKINRRKRGEAMAIAWLMAFSAMFGSALYFSAPSDASTTVAPITVTAQWIGGNCYSRTATHPADADPWTLNAAIVPGCASTATEFQNVRRGQFFGVDPDIGDAFAVSCTVKNAVSGVIIATDYARKNDGHDANCLGRWTA